MSARSHGSRSLEYGPLSWLVGCLLTGFLLGGRWSLARISGFDANPLLEPRTWAVTGLVLLAVWPTRVVLLEKARAFRGWSWLLCWGVVTLVWTPDLDAGAEKAIELLLLLVLLVSTHRLARVIGPEVVIQRTWAVMSVCLMGLAAVALVRGVTADGQRVAVLGGGPNVFGRNMAVLALLSLSAALRGRIQLKWAVWAGVGLTLTVLSGSRGAMLALAAGGLVLTLGRRANLTRRVQLLVLLSVGGIVALDATDVGRQAVELFKYRVLQLTFEQEYASGRWEIYREALELGWRSPWTGAGLGAFQTHSAFDYPHNLELEIFCELGLIGLALYLWGLLAVLHMVVRATYRDMARDLSIFVALLVSAQVSGDVFDSRGVLWLGLLLSMPEPSSSSKRRVGSRSRAMSGSRQVE